MIDLTLPYTKSKVKPHTVLLPDNRTKLETDLVKTQARTTDVPVPYRDLFNPYKCPVDFLPWLATNWGVDFWYSDWPESTKRNIIANIVSLKREKGTLGGIEGYLSYVNGTVVKAVTPPAKGFYQGALTTQDRLDFIASLPAIEVFPYATTRIPPPFRAFVSRDNDTARKKNFYGHVYGQASDGPQLYGRKAVFVDPLHPEIPPAATSYASFADPMSAQTIEQVFISFTATKRAFMRNTGAGLRHSFYRLDGTGTNNSWMQTTRAATNMLSVVLDSNASQQFASFSGDQTYNVNPQRVYQSRVPLRREFMGTETKHGFGPGFYGKGFLRTTAAATLIYDRISIYDASRVPVEKKVRTFYNHARFGISPFNAELTVTFPMFRSQYRRANFYGRGYLKSWNPEPLYRVLDAIHVAKAKRDKILVQPQTYQTVRLGSTLHLGSFDLGQIVSTVS